MSIFFAEFCEICFQTEPRPIDFGAEAVYDSVFPSSFPRGIVEGGRARMAGVWRGGGGNFQPEN